MSGHTAQQETTKAVAQQNTSRAFDRFAGASAIIVSITSICFAFVFLLAVPADQKGAAPASLTSFHADPTGSQLANLLLALGGLAMAVGAVGISHRLREQMPGWAAFAARLGFASGLLTGLSAIYQMILHPVVSNLYVNPPAVSGVPASAIQGAAVAIANLPSPLDPDNFTKFCLTGLWFLAAGFLLLRSRAFPRWLGYVAVVNSAFLLLLFIGGVIGNTTLVLASGVPTSVLLGPLFWLVVGFTLWIKEPEPAA